MTEHLQNQYHPNYVSPPGDTLLETLEAIGMPQAELAKRMDRPVKTINEIVQAKASITAETALQLEQVLHIPASFWLNMELGRQESLARLAEKQRLQSWVGWLKKIPVQDMMQHGWIPTHTEKTLQVLEVLKFFGAASPKAWQAIWESTSVAYRKAPTVTNNFGSLTAWLRQGEIETQVIDCRPYNEELFRQTLIRVRTLTVESVEFWQKELVNLCANAGVAVVFVPELPAVRIYGATRWLTSTKALIQLNLSYETDDQFWFTFFHEAGHIVRHGKRQVFLEIDEKDREWEESEADLFAANCLIDRTLWQQFIAQKSSTTKEDVQQFASQVGIAPGIVVGRLQQTNLLPVDRYNDLKRHLTWRGLCP